MENMPSKKLGKIQYEHMGSRMARSYPKDGHAAILKQSKYNLHTRKTEKSNQSIMVMSVLKVLID